LNYNGNDNNNNGRPSTNANDNQWPAVPPHLIGEARRASIVGEHRDSDATLYNVNNPDSLKPLGKATPMSSLPLLLQITPTYLLLPLSAASQSML
jgi:hypothetical protein